MDLDPATPAHGDWRPDIPKGARPVYLAIAQAIADDLAAGRLSPGDRLPPQRDLAAALGLDFTTVTRAYAEARRRGLVQAHVGRGTFVSRPPRDAPRPPSAGMADMSINLPPTFDDVRLASRMWAAIRELEAEDGLPLLLRYQEAGGAMRDRAAGAVWLKDRIPGLAAERTLVSAGAQPALAAILATLVRRGGTLCTGALTYPGLRSAAAQLEIALVGLGMDAEGVTPEALDACCRSRSPQALYCTPTLQNPTAATMSLARRETIVAIARRHKVPIIEDDAYGRLPSDSPPPLAAIAPDLVYHLAGLAKHVSPALRIAYVVPPDANALARTALALRAFAGMASPLTAAVATRWIESGVAEAALRAIRAEAVARRRLAAEMIPQARPSRPEAYHLWIDLPPPWTRGAFQARLRSLDVAVVAADAFAVAAPAPEGVRISLGAAASREGLAAALGKVREVLAQDPEWGAGIV
jgi:DNA-binding transcriptional MocR family regulator